MSHYQSIFTARSAATRVRFGPGVRHELAGELDLLGARRALILATPGQKALAEEVAELCGEATAGLFTQAEMHTPVAISEQATAHAQAVGADVLVAAGGGSTIGLGKAIALRTDLPQIVLPTTYAGSEATAILGQTEAGVKTTLTSPKVQPEVILYDAELVATLPVAMTVTSALNAMAHAAEGLYARDRSPLSTLMAIEGLQAFRDALPALPNAPQDPGLRGETLYGAWLCGTVLGQVGMALHHKLCHTLGGSCNLPHAETHAIVLPHAIGYNARAVPELLAPVARIFGHAEPGRALYDFARDMGATLALRDLGLTHDALDRIVDSALDKLYWNPRPLERKALRDLLEAAWEGSPPPGA